MPATPQVILMTSMPLLTFFTLTRVYAARARLLLGVEGC